MVLVVAALAVVFVHCGGRKPDAPAWWKEVKVPAAPGACEPLADDRDAVTVLVADTGDVSTRDGGVIVHSPPKGALASGYPKQLKRNDDSPEIVPLEEAVARDRKAVLASDVFRGRDEASMRAYLVVAGTMHPLPDRARQELIATIKAAGITTLRQVFASPSGSACSVPLER